MSKSVTSLKLTIFFVIVFTSLNWNPLNSTAKAHFWDTQKRGTNIFNYEISEEIIMATKKYGISFIRLAPDSFSSKSKDFLIGDADNYQGLVAEDLKKLKSILDLCNKHMVPVVLVFLSIPGSRWKQNNGGKDDLKLWQSDKFLADAVKFWHDIATALQEHPALVGYDILNEPHPERCTDTLSSNIAKNSTPETQAILHKFNTEISKAIRNVDKETAIIIESSGYASAQSLEKMIPIDDKLKDSNILYSFHMYDPENYTFCRSGEQFVYPGKIIDPDTRENKFWNKDVIELYLNSVVNWQKKHNISSSRILVGEFGAFRYLNGITDYFKDLIAVFNNNNWHWAVYSFREDKWDKMNYELASTVNEQGFWRAQYLNQLNDLYDPTNPIFVVLRNAWNETITF